MLIWCFEVLYVTLICFALTKFFVFLSVFFKCSLDKRHLGNVYFFVALCIDGALSLHLHVVALPVSVTMSGPSKTAQNLNRWKLISYFEQCKSSDSFSLKAFQIYFSILVRLFSRTLVFIWAVLQCQEKLFCRFVLVWNFEMKPLFLENPLFLRFEWNKKVLLQFGQVVFCFCAFNIFADFVANPKIFLFQWLYLKAHSTYMKNVFTAIGARGIFWRKVFSKTLGQAFCGGDTWMLDVFLSEFKTMEQNCL